MTTTTNAHTNKHFTHQLSRRSRLIGLSLASLVCVSCGASTPAANTTDTTTPADTPSAGVPVKMQGMVAYHNATRQAVGVTEPMRWSNKLANYAQEWSDHLAFKNACNMAHRSTLGFKRESYGENIYWASPLRWSDGRTEVQTVNASDVARAWAEEKPDYNYASNSCQPGKQCGHYTQMVWRDSTEVGCGMTLCPDKAQIWVCNYNPPGNWVGQKPY